MSRDFLFLADIIIKLFNDFIIRPFAVINAVFRTSLALYNHHCSATLVDTLGQLHLVLAAHQGKITNLLQIHSDGVISISGSNALVSIIAKIIAILILALLVVVLLLIIPCFNGLDNIIIISAITGHHDAAQLLLGGLVSSIQRYYRHNLSHRLVCYLRLGSSHLDRWLLLSLHAGSFSLGRL